MTMTSALGNNIPPLVPAGFLTRKELAEMAECTYGTVIRWEMLRRIVPDAYMENGKTETVLYRLAAQDVQDFLAHMHNRKVGT